MKTVSILSLAVLTMAGSTASAWDPTPGEKISSVTSAPTITTALNDFDPRGLNKEILNIAQDDIVLYRTQRIETEFLVAMVSRLAKNSRMTEEQVWAALSK